MDRRAGWLNVFVVVAVCVCTRYVVGMDFSGNPMRASFVSGRSFIRLHWRVLRHDVECMEVHA